MGLDHFRAHWCKFVTIWYKLGWGLLWRQAGSVQFGADLVQFGATVGKSLAAVYIYYINIMRARSTAEGLWRRRLDVMLHLQLTQGIK